MIELKTEEDIVDDQDGQDWWVSQFGPSAYAVTWGKFMGALRSGSHADPRVAALVERPDVVVALAAKLRHRKDCVTALQWDATGCGISGS